MDWRNDLVISQSDKPNEWTYAQAQIRAFFFKNIPARKEFCVIYLLMRP